MVYETSKVYKWNTCYTKYMYIIEETRQAIVYVLCYAKRKDSLLNLIDMTIVCTCIHTEFP